MKETKRKQGISKSRSKKTKTKRGGRHGTAMSLNTMPKTQSNIEKDTPLSWERFVKACKAKHTMPTTFVKQFGYTPASVTRWKNGSIPRDSTIMPLAKALDVTVEYLFGIGPDIIDDREKIRSVFPMRCVEVMGLVEDYEATNNEIVGYEASEKMDTEEEKFLAFQCRDDGMSPDICLGDIIIVSNRSESWDATIRRMETGSLIAFFQKERGVFIRKTIKGQDGMLTLVASHNATLEVLDEQSAKAQNIQIVGKVVESRRKY